MTDPPSCEHHPPPSRAPGHSSVRLGPPALGETRVGTWNLAGRWSSAHQALLSDAGVDVWLLTEVPARTELPGFAIHLSKALMAERRHWAGVAVRDGLPFDTFTPDPHPASAAANVGGLTYCSSILPWRSCGAGDPWRGSTVTAKTQAATRALVDALSPGETIWGGDWHHALRGREYAGSLGGRQAIVDALAALELTVATADLPHRVEGLSTIDHVALPSRATVTRAERLTAARNGSTLSDHDSYVVDFALPRR